METAIRSAQGVIHMKLTFENALLETTDKKTVYVADVEITVDPYGYGLLCVRCGDIKLEAQLVTRNGTDYWIHEPKAHKIVETNHAVVVWLKAIADAMREHEQQKEQHTKKRGGK